MEPGGILTSPLSPCPLCPQLRNLITDVSQHKLLVFAGPCVEETGELMLQTGCFSLRDFIQIFTDKEVRGQGWPETPRKELLPPPGCRCPSGAPWPRCWCAEGGPWAVAARAAVCSRPPASRRGAGHEEAPQAAALARPCCRAGEGQLAASWSCSLGWGEWEISPPRHFPGCREREGAVGVPREGDALCWPREKGAGAGQGTPWAAPSLALGAQSLLKLWLSPCRWGRS